MIENNMDKKDKDEEFSLYTEKIVVSPAVKYKKLIKCGKFVLAAIGFGAIASVVMAVVYPHISGMDKKGDVRQALVIEKDQYTMEDDSMQQTESPRDTQTISDYTAAAAMLKVASQVARDSIVTVDTYRSNVDDFVAQTKSSSETVAVTIGNVGGEYILLTSLPAVQSSDSIVVKFSDSIQVNATIIGHDEETGIALLSVKETDIPSNIRPNVVIALLDNSYNVKQGDVVIAAGKLYGQIKSVDYCAITSISKKVAIDNSYSVFNTGLKYQSGDYYYLFNQDGNVIGISFTDSDGVVSVLGISDLKTLIEEMTNNTGISYVGIRGQNVTSALATMYGLPMGIYITDIVVDSPAYEAGLQAGDVITSVDDNMLLTIQGFSETLYQCEKGQQLSVKVKRLGKDTYNEVTFNVIVDTR